MIITGLQFTLRAETAREGKLKAAATCFIIPSFDLTLADPVNLAQLSPYDS